MVREEGFESPSIDFQSQWERMLSKREGRFRWFIKHGTARDGESFVYSYFC